MNQVAVTGGAVVSPIGSGVPAFWDALLAGRPAVVIGAGGIGIDVARFLSHASYRGR